LERNLAYLANQDLHLTDPWKEGVFNNLFFASPAVANRTLRSQLASLYQRTCPALLYTAPHCADATKPSSRHGKLKIGVVLKLMDQDNFGQLLCNSIISNFSKEQFSFQVFVFSPTAVTIPDLIQQQADSCDTLPIDLGLARQHIAQRQLDLLFYPDIGPEPFLYFLAFARLAPVQCAVWEDAVTAGLPNVDYFITYYPQVAAEVTPADLSPVIRVGNLLPYSAPPLLSTSTAKTRHAFGLTDQHHLYLCPQALPKFHPDFDLILAAILERDLQGQIVFLEGHYPHWTELLQQRFFHTIPRVINRLHFLPRQHLTDYFNLADVMLDTFYWGGTITTYHALSMGTPVVALSSPSLERQFAYTYYQEMGLKECVANNPQEYVDIALRLGTDSSYRQQIQAQLLATNRRAVSKGQNTIQELEQFWITVT
jgi:predicted O-linked N-acetylglucosamine transferase (SPINDLY family)